MSVAKRIISGSLATWAKIGMTFVVQIILVPVYLTYWKVEVYGVWIAIQALLSILGVLDIGHQNYLGYEFLKLGQHKIKELSKILWSGALIGVFLGLFQILVIIILLYFGIISTLIACNFLDKSLLTEAIEVLFVQSFVWLLTSSIGGILGRALQPFGYFARMSWWGVFATFTTSIAPLVAVVNHQGLFVTGLVSAIAIILYNIPVYFDIFRLYKRIGIKIEKPSILIGWNNFILSLALSGKGLLDSARQQGVRLILAPLAGASALVAFTTMRTGANVALQGLGTITSPMMPELMNFLNEKDQKKCEGAFASVWAVLVVFMAPGVVILQIFIPSLFKIWTRGKVVFDPLLFALLSMTVLIYALAQPAIAVITGNNKLKIQLLTAIITAFVLVGGLFVLVPLIGIVGAAISLVISEIIDTQLYKIAAKKWFFVNGLQWPYQQSRIAAFSVFLSTIVLAILILFPTMKIIIGILAFSAFSWNIWRFYMHLPEIVINRLKGVIMK